MGTIFEEAGVRFRYVEGDKPVEAPFRRFNYRTVNFCLGKYIGQTSIDILGNEKEFYSLLVHWNQSSPNNWAYYPI